MSDLIEKTTYPKQNDEFSYIRSFGKWLFWSSIFALLISFYAMYRVNYVYWGNADRAKDDQGTIFAVQTVEFNMANSAFPLKISQLLVSENQDTQEIQKLLNSGYGLIGFIVTDCKKATGNCEHEKILYQSKYKNKTWWLKDIINTEEFKQSEFSPLRIPPPIHREWSYKGPKEHIKIIELPANHQQNENSIIGRLYYVRREAPTFKQQLSYWFKQNLTPGSTDAKYYTPILLRFIFVAITVSALLCWHDKKRHKANADKIAEEHKKLLAETQLREEKEKLLESETQLRIEQEKSKEAEKQHRLQLEDLMAMFAHKFRGPLDSLDFNYRHGCLDQTRFMRSLETMRGLLNTFSAISTNQADFIKQIKSDISGSQTIEDILRYSLEFVIGHLTTSNKISTIHQHYLMYAKKNDLVDPEVGAREWVQDYASQEIELQKIFSDKFFDYEQNNDSTAIFSLTENLFFRLETKGFDVDTINFKPFEHKSSFLTIILSEVLTNAFKYYNSKEHAEVSLYWLEDNDMVTIRCLTPSSKLERRQDKGSGKGHFFLKRLTEMVNGTFSFKYSENDATPCTTELKLPRHLFYQS